MSEILKYIYIYIYIIYMAYIKYSSISDIYNNISLRFFSTLLHVVFHPSLLMVTISQEGIAASIPRVHQGGERTVLSHCDIT